VIDIYAQDIIQQYAQIETYSQNKLSKQPLPSGLSARNMGKNDLWIAACTSVIQASLITTDQDFTHLHNTYLNVIEIPIK
jgi:predicted nucleic acid-binding protein